MRFVSRFCVSGSGEMLKTHFKWHTRLNTPRYAEQYNLVLNFDAKQIKDNLLRQSTYCNIHKKQPSNTLNK